MQNTVAVALTVLDHACPLLSAVFTFHMEARYSSTVWLNIPQNMTILL